MIILLYIYVCVQIMYISKDSEELFQLNDVSYVIHHHV